MPSEDIFRPESICSGPDKSSRALNTKVWLNSDDLNRAQIFLGDIESRLAADPPSGDDEN